MDSDVPLPTRFRLFQVTEKKAENRLITSFLLRPVEVSDWRPFIPGQFLVLRIPGTDGGHVLRHYSISSDPAVDGCYRISVKREEAPRDGVPDGRGSCHLHRNVDVGAILAVDGPHGEFRLDRGSSRPLVLLSGGVGVTPLLSMLYAASRDPGREIFFIHACRDGSVHAFSREVAEAAARHDGTHYHVIYEQPRPEDRSQGHPFIEGFIDRKLLQRLLPFDDYDFYLCGPGPFMQAIYSILRSLGVEKGRIAYEFFGPSTLLEPADPEPAVAPDQGNARFGGEKSARTVSFARSGHVALWTDEESSLLEFAELCGLQPDFSCRVGICGTCSVQLLSGGVDYIEQPLSPPAAGEILLCCATPRGPVVIDL